ncbi:MAG: helix-turn-helix domain-containing protein [Prolixibacteraceae bacterium]
MNNASIGQRILTLRETLQITREELCERSRLTQQHLENIENDQHIPSISTLIRISRALGVRVGTFLDDSKNIGPTISKTEKPTNDSPSTLHPVFDNNKIEFMPLAANKAGRHMEPFLVELHKGENVGYQKSSHEGEEFLYVLEGSIHIEYGKDSYDLKKGESIYYDSIIEHRISTEEETGAKVLANIYTPF